MSAPAATWAGAPRSAALGTLARTAAPAALLLALTAGSAVLRTRAIDAGFWIDEGLTLGIASQPVTDIPGLLRQDGSPPLYYLLLHGWTALAGAGDATARVPSLLAALACVPAGLWAGRSLFSPRAGWICALLLAVCPLVTVMAQEARMYALGALLALVMCTAWAHAFALRRRTYAIVFAVALALLLYTHTWGVHLALGTLAGVGVLLARSPDRRGLARDAALAYGAALVVWLPWIPTLAFQAAHTGAPWSETPGPERLLDPIWVPLGEAAGGAVALIACAAGLVRWLHRDGDRRRAVLAGLGVTVAVAGCSAWAAAQIEPGWADRYLTLFAGPVLLLVAAGLAALPVRMLAAALAATTVLWAADTASERKSNAREVAAEVAPALRAGDTVVVAHPEQIAVLHRYMRGGLSWATTLGPAADPRTFDWRGVVGDLRSTAPGPTAARLLTAVRPGERVVLAMPVAGEVRWEAPWTSLVLRRAREWEGVLARRSDLRRVTSAPARTDGLPPTSMRLVVYERLGARPYSRAPR